MIISENVGQVWELAQEANRAKDPLKFVVFDVIKIVIHHDDRVCQASEVLSESCSAASKSSSLLAMKSPERLPETAFHCRGKGCAKSPEGLFGSCPAADADNLLDRTKVRSQDPLGLAIVPGIETDG